VKVAYVSRAYPGVVEAFYAARAGLAGEPSHTQCAAFEEFAFGWAGAWGPALAPFGHTLREFWLDLEPQHLAWAREHGRPHGAETTEALLIDQVREFAPDVLWLDYPDPSLLRRLRAACASLAAAIGWVGSALPEGPLWREFDAVLSCDAESVAALERGGARAELLHHAFQERVLARLFERPPSMTAVFVGQFDPGAPSHAAREAVLETLLETHRIAVFSPPIRRPDLLETAARRTAWEVASGLKRAGVPESTLGSLPGLGSAARWPGPPRGALPPRLAAAIEPARFGLAMYQTLRDSRLALNVQGVRRTHPASNMRLFEATGVGTCLVTDDAGAIAELFVPGREVVTFDSAGDCVEKVGWLLDHEPECSAIARAGHARCLAEHTFTHRAARLDEILRGVAG